MDLLDEVWSAVPHFDTCTGRATSQTAQFNGSHHQSMIEHDMYTCLTWGAGAKTKGGTLPGVRATLVVRRCLLAVKVDCEEESENRNELQKKTAMITRMW